MTKEVKLALAALVLGLAVVFMVMQLKQGPRMDPTSERVQRDLWEEIDPDGKYRDRERAIPVRIVE